MERLYSISIEKFSMEGLICYDRGPVQFQKRPSFFSFFLFLVVESAAVFLWKYISKRLGSIADKAKRRDEEEEDGV